MTVPILEPIGNMLPETKKKMAYMAKKRGNYMKNPAYGRHQLSRPMRIVEPIQRETVPLHTSDMGESH